MCYCGSTSSVVHGVCWGCQEWDWLHHNDLLRDGYSETEIFTEMVRRGREQRAEYQAEQVEVWRVNDG